MKPKLKPPGTRRLKLKCDVLLSTSAFKFNLRRYTKADVCDSSSSFLQGGASKGAGEYPFDDTGRGEGEVSSEAGAYTRSLFSST